MNASRRPRQPPQRPAPPPLVPLSKVIRDYEKWRDALPDKPNRGVLRDYWKKQDAQYAQRPDYLLWRELQEQGSPPQRRQDPAELAARAIKAPEPMIHWPAMALTLDLLQNPASLTEPKLNALHQALRQRLGNNKHPLQPLKQAPEASRLLQWLIQSYLQPTAATWTELSTILQSKLPNWKLGQKADLSFWKSEDGWPFHQQQISRRLSLAIHHLCLHQLKSASTHSPELASWHITAWMLLRDTRPAHIPARSVELDILLSAASTARIMGDVYASLRLTALALHLLPQHLPEALRQRFRVAAWTAAEAGLATPALFKTVFEELPFPGEPANSELGQAAAAQYFDATDPANTYLTEEVQKDPVWEVLRQSGANLQHPFAALMWIARKAQSLALKKQQALLEAAATLALRHHRLTTFGRLLPYLTPSAKHVLTFAETLRQHQRHMPFLRDEEIWQDWTHQLRLAWARLEPEAIQDPEQLFLLHEILQDREVTLLRSLPLDFRVLALRHLYQRKQPTALVQTLSAELKQTRILEHQRQVELWSIAGELRDRPELAVTVWISLVMKGEPNQGRYSVIIQGASGRRLLQDRFRFQKGSTGEIEIASLWEKLVPLLQEIHPNPARLWIAQDAGYQHLPWQTGLHERGLTPQIHWIPSFEWAFRVLREAPTQAQAGIYLWPEGSEIQLHTQPPPVDTAVLLGSVTAQQSTQTRWLSSPPQDNLLRSALLGAYPQLVSDVTLSVGALKDDLVRLSLAQNTRQIRASREFFSTATHSESSNNQSQCYGI